MELDTYRRPKLKRELVDGGMLPIELVRARLKNEKVARDFKALWRFYK